MKQVYWAIRYGEWDWGWESYKNKPRFGLYFDYYNGELACLHLGKLWINVIY